jgi:hypothetical protein
VSIGAQTALALVRALIIAGSAIAASGPLSTWLAGQRGRARTLAWALLLAPFFTPPLLISYAFSKFALALVFSPWSHEALYVGALTLKLIPVAVIAQVLMPSPLSAEARHSFQTLAAATWRTRAIFRLRGAGPAPWVAGGLVFLLAFADFELASLWSVRTWTVAIFDAQIGGLPLPDTLHLAAGPWIVEGLVLALVARQVRHFASALRATPSLNRRTPWLYLVISAALLSLLPLAIVTAQAFAGFRALSENFVLGHEIAASVLFAVGAAVSASALASLGRRDSAAKLALAASGLLGALTVSLAVLALFQLPLLRSAYDTPLPLALALTILLLPLAVLLGALQSHPTPALHVARQIGSRPLIWELHTRPRAIALGLLFCWAYYDFTASSILAPIGLTPVFVRLHNLAHYGQTAVLSAMLLAACLAPALFVILGGMVARLTAGKLLRG